MERSKSSKYRPGHRNEKVALPAEARWKRRLAGTTKLSRDYNQNAGLIISRRINEKKIGNGISEGKLVRFEVPELGPGGNIRLLHSPVLSTQSQELGMTRLKRKDSAPSALVMARINEDANERRIHRAKRAKEQEILSREKSRHRTVNYLAKKTHFREDQIEGLLKIHKEIVASKGGSFNRIRFIHAMQDTLGIFHPLILERVFSAFDGDNKGMITESEWVMGLSTILRGTLDEQIMYSYDVYDLNGDNSISRSEVLYLLKNCFRPVPGWTREQNNEMKVKEFIDLIMGKMDTDNDGYINFRDFRRIVRNDPLLLEGFGPCLPKKKNAAAFMSLFDPNGLDNFACILSPKWDPAWRHEQTKFDKLDKSQRRKSMRNSSQETLSKEHFHKLHSGILAPVRHRHKPKSHDRSRRRWTSSLEKDISFKSGSVKGSDLSNYVPPSIDITKKSSKITHVSTKIDFNPSTSTL